MPERPFTRADLDLLRRWDTPTICNAMEVVAPARRGRGFTLQPFTAADPSLPPICGIARTGQIRAAAPSGRTRRRTAKPGSAGTNTSPMPTCRPSSSSRTWMKRRASAPSGAR